MRPFLRVRHAVVALFLLSTAASFSQVRLAVRPPIKRQRHAEAALTPDEQAAVTKNCGENGVPKLAPDQNFGSTTIIYRKGYVLEHSAFDKIPLWVCEGFNKTQWDPSSARTDNFRPDPLLKSGERSELTDYEKKGFDRGHMAPAADFGGKDLKSESFFLSNMAPQAPKLNRVFWKNLEDLVRKWSTETSPIIVYTGGFFFDPKEESPATANGQVEFKRIGKNSVAVPTHFYKVVFGKNDKGQMRAVAFVLENKEAPKGATFESVIQSIEWIEDRTGITFMPDLDTAVSAKLKHTPGKLFYANADQ